MAKPRAKNLMERFGFQDPDLKTPKHDAIMMWLDGEIEELICKNIHPPIYFLQNMIQLAERSDIAISYDKSSNKLEIVDKKNRKQFKDVIRELYQYEQWIKFFWEESKAKRPKVPEITVVSKQWESVIVEGTQVVGFIDLVVLFEVPFVPAELFGITIRAKDLEAKNYYTICFEVKSTIPSVGELIRQLRMYERHFSKNSIVVVAPTNKFEKLLKKQGFGFLQCPEV